MGNNKISTDLIKRRPRKKSKRRSLRKKGRRTLKTNKKSLHKKRWKGGGGGGDGTVNPLFHQPESLKDLEQREPFQKWAKIQQINNDIKKHMEIQEIDDGETDFGLGDIETGMDETLVRLRTNRTIHTENWLRTLSTPKKRMIVGDNVEGNARDRGNWYPGRIVNITVKNNEQLFDVDYDKYDKYGEQIVPLSPHFKMYESFTTLRLSINDMLKRSYDDNKIKDLYITQESFIKQNKKEFVAMRGSNNINIPNNSPLLSFDAENGNDSSADIDGNNSSADIDENDMDILYSRMQEHKGMNDQDAANADNVVNTSPRLQLAADQYGRYINDIVNGLNVLFKKGSNIWCRTQSGEMNTICKKYKVLLYDGICSTLEYIIKIGHILGVTTEHITKLQSLYREFKVKLEAKGRMPH